MLIEDVQLVKIEAGRAPRATREIEPLNSLLSGEDLIVTMCPGQACQVVAHGFGEVAQCLVLLCTCRSVTLRQFFAVGAVDKRKVREARDLPAAVVVDGDLPGCVRDVVGAPRHVCDAHVVIIDDDCKQVRWCSISPHNDEVIDILVWDLNATHDSVFPRSASTIIRCLDTHHGLHSRRRLEVRPNIAALARVPERYLVLLGLRPHCIEGLLGAVALIGASVCKEFLGDLLVPGDVPALPHDLTVVFAAQPRHALYDRLNGTLIIPLGIGVLDPELELTTMVLGIEIAEQCCSRSADVKVPCWRRSEPRDNRSATADSPRSSNGSHLLAG
mmetsp:Transcript_29720/g.78914  ORF Transcript_29720/g.78914 Transcript_29720/m.78914 type:complete len:330 (+) Transcript_29720:1220-2209(+)